MDETQRSPWPMRPFAIRGLAEAWLARLRPPISRWIVRLQGLADQRAMSDPEIDVYATLLEHADGSRAFPRIMRGFELTARKQRFPLEVLAGHPYPAQVVWGREDPALGQRSRG